MFLAAALAASWPSALAAALVKHAILGGHGSLSVVVAGTALSSLLSAWVAGVGWRSASEASGVWVLYGILAAFAGCSIWAILSTMAVPTTRPLDLAIAPVGASLLAFPLVVLVGFSGALELSVLLAWLRRGRRERVMAAIALVTNFAAGVALAVAGQIWA